MTIKRAGEKGTAAALDRPSDVGRQQLLAQVSILAAVIAWGLAPVATRYLVLKLPPISLLVVRFIIAGLLFLPIAVRGRRPLSRREIVSLVPAALLGIVGYYVPVTFGVQRLSASTAGLILAMEPGWILLAAVLLGAEEVRPISWIGVGIAFCGVGLLFLSTSTAGTGSDQLLGEALVLLAGILFAAYTVYVRRISYRYGALNATALTTLLGSIPFLAFLGTVRISELEALGVGGWFALALLAVGSTVLATILWNRGVVIVGGAGAGPYLNAVPLVSVLGGYILLGERLPALTLLSGALIIGGTALSVQAARRPKGPGKAAALRA